MKKNNSDALRLALVTHGPIASSVNSDRKTFRFYSHGIYDDPKCGDKLRLDRAYHNSLSSHARAMSRPRQVGGLSTRPAPEGPSWAVKQPEDETV